MSHESATTGSSVSANLVRRHLVFGWACLLAFLTLGLVLEAFHGFKVGWYVGLDNETRRLMWTLAHAHGVLIGLVSLAYALTLHICPTDLGRRQLASTCLIVAGILLPGGFFLGGLFIYQGDPGIGVFLSPVGGAFLFAAVAMTVRDVCRID